MNKIFSTDIDGVLNNYPLCWLNYIKQETGLVYKSTDEAKLSLGKVAYSKIKSAYRRSEYKENIAFSDDARLALIEIRNMGFEIVAATSRPLLDPEFPGLRDLTSRWLRKNIDFPIQVVYKSKDVNFADNLTNIKYHIDDELKYAIPIANKNITTFLIERNENYLSIPPNIIKISCFNEVVSILKGKANE